MPGGYLKGNGVWGTAGNWSSGAVPDGDDVVIIPASLTSDTTDAGGDADGIDHDLLYLHRGYTGSFGSTGSPILTAADVVKFYSGGPVFFDCHNNSAAVKTDFLTIAMAQAGLVCEIGGAAGAAGDIDFIRCLRGLITLKGSIEFGAAGWVQIGHVRNRASDARVTIEATADTLPLLQIFGGVCTSLNTLTTVYVAGGTLIKDTAQLTTCFIGPGGVVNYNQESLDTTPQFHILSGGTLDLLTNSVPKTLGNVYAYPGSTLLYDPDLHTITLTDLRDGVL